MNELDFAEFEREQALAERAGKLRRELAGVHAAQEARADADFRAAHRELYEDVAAKMDRLHADYANRSGAGNVVSASHEVEAAEAARQARERTRANLGTSA